MSENNCLIDKPYEQIEPEKLLHFICELGVRLIRNGAEIYRVEESLRLVLSSYGISKTEIFAIPALVIVSFESDNKSYTKQSRVKGSVVNLNRLNLLNSLCRKICNQNISFQQSSEELQQIATGKLYPVAISYIAYGMAAFFFTLFWGGTLIDAVIAMTSGFIVKLSVSVANKFKTNLFFANVLSGFCLTIIPVLLSVLFPGYIQLDKIIIGVIMLVVPGIAIANVMRDVLAGDTLTALTRFTEVLIIGIGIAIGIAIPMALIKVII